MQGKLPRERERAGRAAELCSRADHRLDEQQGPRAKPDHALPPARKGSSHGEFKTTVREAAPRTHPSCYCIPARGVVGGLRAQAAVTEL